MSGWFRCIQYIVEWIFLKMQYTVLISLARSGIIDMRKSVLLKKLDICNRRKKMSENKVVGFAPNVAKFESNNKSVMVKFFECETLDNGEPIEDSIKHSVELSFDARSFGSLAEAFMSTSAFVDKLLEGENIDD